MIDSKIPIEMRSFRSWALSGSNKAPLSTDGTRTFNISVRDNKYFLTFEEAIYYSKLFNLDYGFVLTENDPFTCIDLDYTDEDSQLRKGQKIDESKWTNQKQINLYWDIIQTFNSYTEFSKFGKGHHIWVKGDIGYGRRRDGVEVYSRHRYMICTGNPINNVAIKDCQTILDNMTSTMSPIEKILSLEELPQEKTDDEIIQIAINAENKDKFIKLARGEWNNDYPSQSEADFALMAMLCFYSPSNEQCRRIFRMTELGTREKAVKDNRYLNETLLKIRSRQQQEKEAEITQQQETEKLIQSLNSKQKQNEFLHTEFNTDDEEKQKPAALVYAKLTNQEPIEDGQGIPWPPGFIGILAKFIYDSAPRPVKEVAIVSAIGLMAGICGKAWTIPQSGLNLYVILVARSGIGKEAMHSGIALLLNAVSSRCPSIFYYVNFTDFVSGPALSKTIAKQNSFVNVAGEFGQKLQRLANDTVGKDGAATSFRRVLTDLYQKSGPQSIVGGLTYSDAANSTSSTSGAAFSMIGETTPATFYDCLTPSMMSDGFLSRFTIIEYSGKRPPLNENRILEPSANIVDYLAQITDQATNLINRSAHTPVRRTTTAAEILNKFEKECDHQINSTEDDCYRQMWNRAGLKVLKLSALLAVADNFINPSMTDKDVNWAINLVKHDISLFKHKIESGDIGNSDFARENKIISICKQYLIDQPGDSYTIDNKLRSSGFINRKYIQQRIGSLSLFTRHPLGGSRILDITIKSLIDSGYLVEVNSSDVVRQYGSIGKIYRILNINNLF